MILIISTNKYVFTYDLLNKKILSTINNKKRPSYGISWYRDRLFIAWRGPCEILEYDIDLKPTGRKCKGSKLGDLHQIICFDNKIWVANTGKNLISIFDINTLDLVEDWCPHLNRDQDDNHILSKDNNIHYKHYNSIMFNKKKIYINAHMTKNNPPSKLWIFKYKNKKFISKISGGISTHNIFFIDNKPIVCDSENGKILSLQDKTHLSFVKYSSFLRGVSMPKNMIIVGRSDKIIDRDKRAHGQGGLVIYNDHSFTKNYSLGLYMGQVHEVRCLDEKDKAHPTNIFWR